MIQHLFREIGGIGIYGIISVCLFFVIFGVMLVWALQLKKPFLQSMESLPLEEDVSQPIQPNVKPKGDHRHE